MDDCRKCIFLAFQNRCVLKLALTDRHWIWHAQSSTRIPSVGSVYSTVLPTPKWCPVNDDFTTDQWSEV